MRILKVGGPKSALAISLMALGMAGTASAAFTACPTASPALPYQISATGTITAGASTDSSFTCGGLSFSNFSEVDAGGASIPSPWSGHIDLASAGSSGGVTTLGFNPNLSFNNATDSADLWVYFTVSGAGLDQVDLSVTGVGASVSETVCAAAFGPGNSCSNVLTSLSNTGAAAKLSGLFGPVSTIYIFKDIHVGPVGSSAGHLTSLGQSFHSSATVPEPATLSMMGLGLLGLGLIGRRRKS